MATGHVLVLDIDALYTFFSMFIHPSPIIRNKFINALFTIRFTKMKVLRLERKTVNQRLQDCIVLRCQTSPMLIFM